MKKLFTLLLFSISIIAFSQQISPKVISSGGEQYDSENGEVSLSWTVGETSISTLESDIVLTQGFHQDFFIITAIDELKLEDISIDIFPNPTADFINIKWQSDSKSEEKVIIQLLDINGKVLKEVTFQSDKELMRLNLQSFKKSHYIMQFIYGNQIKSYKIIKS